jgi:SAM-dependent methyltransferase
MNDIVHASKILKDVSDYYSEKIKAHGDTPLGVDWNGAKSQYLRFQQLCNIIDGNQSHFSMVDLGCGYGALYDYLKSHYKKFSYTGIDISEDMLESGRAKFGSLPDVNFYNSTANVGTLDFGIASGLFNVRLSYDDQHWLNYITSTLNSLNQVCSKGFSFNCLTEYSDIEKRKPYLFYANPTYIFDYCKKHFSKNVSLLHDYDLYEFTILVRKAL